jgi:hypothetical protein
VPHVEVFLEPSPDIALERGRWTRMLGALGVTRHAVRIEEGDGFLLVGADLLGMADLTSLRAQVDRLEADGERPSLARPPELERYVRWRADAYRWAPARGTRAEGLEYAGSGSWPRFDAGSLDGDVLQACVRRHRRVPRPKD